VAMTIQRMGDRDLTFLRMALSMVIPRIRD
jgi:hypothetical protein